MKRNSFSSLQIRLIALVLMAVIPALELTLYTFIEHRRQTAQEVKSNALRLARLAAATQQQYIEASHQLLTTLIQFHRGRIRSKFSFSAFLSDLIKQYPHYANLGIASPNGDLINSAVPSSRPVNYADRSWFKRALQARDFVIGDYVVGYVTRKAILPFAHPDMSDIGQIQVIFFGAIDLAWLNQLVAKTELPEGAAVTIVDHNGMILARYPEPEKSIGKTLPETDIIHTILTQGEGTAEAAGVDGIQRLYAFAPLAYAKVNRELVRNLIALTLVALLALMGAWFVGGAFIIHPVNRLLETTRCLAEGDLTARAGISCGQGEIGQLAHVL